MFDGAAIVLRVIGVLILYGRGILSNYVTPTVSLVSCLHQTVTLQVDNATLGGVVYIRNEDTIGPIIGTVDGTVVYTCDFVSCHINWDERFHLVVQRRVSIQTHHDLIQWFICIADLDTVLTMDVGFEGELEGNSMDFEVRPGQALMRMFAGGLELTSGSPVKLGTELNMLIQITDNEDGLLDITPKACWASSVELLTDQCPVDRDLFGGFKRLSAGNMSNTFYMFRPTSVLGGPLDVVFLCRLKVCMVSCEQKQCNDTDDDNGSRRRRQVGQLEEERPSTIVIGATLRSFVSGDGNDEREVYQDDSVCFPTDIIVVAVTMFAFFFLTLIGTTVLNCYKYNITKHQHVTASKDITHVMNTIKVKHGDQNTMVNTAKGVQMDVVTGKDITHVMNSTTYDFKSAAVKNKTVDQNTMANTPNVGTQITAGPGTLDSRSCCSSDAVHYSDLARNVAASLVCEYNEYRQYTNSRIHTRHSIDCQPHRDSLGPYENSSVRRKSASNIL